MGLVRHLYEAIRERVHGWRGSHYRCAEYPAIGEILEYAVLPESDDLRFLRRPQLRALETYWYLRLVEGMPRIPDLHARRFPMATERLVALGLPIGNERVVEILTHGGGAEGALEWVTSDDALTRELKLEGLHETLTLDYPSCIFALAMGAGKTILIGASLCRRIPEDVNVT